MSHFVSLPFKAEEVDLLGERVGLVTVIAFISSEDGPLAIVVFEDGRLGDIDVCSIKLPSHEPATEIP